MALFDWGAGSFELFPLCTPGALRVHAQLSKGAERLNLEEIVKST